MRLNITSLRLHARSSRRTRGLAGYAIFLPSIRPWLALSFTLTALIAGCGSIEDTMSHNVVTIRPLPDEQLIEAEHALDGPIPVGPLTISLFIPDRSYVLSTPRLDVWRPAGHERTDTALARAVADELAETFGGWFTGDVAPLVRLYDDFYSDSVHAYLATVSARARWGTGQGPFYFVAYRVDEWQVQAFGRSGDLHAVFLARDVDDTAAIDTLGPLERRRQLDTLLRRAVPRLDVEALQARDQEPAANPAMLTVPSLRDDLLLAAPGITVRSGVRRRVAASSLREWSVLEREHLYGRGTTLPLDHPLFHGVRIVVDRASRR